MHNPKRLPANTKKKQVSQSQPTTIPHNSEEEEMELLLDTDHTAVQQNATNQPTLTFASPAAMQESLPVTNVIPREQNIQKSASTTSLTSKFDPNTFKQNLLATIWPGSVGTSLY